MVLKLGDIEFGAPDANKEFVLAIKRKAEPIFMAAYIQPPISEYQKLLNGEKFFVYGHKGTGKTVILRHLEKFHSDRGATTGFVLFKEEIQDAMTLEEY